jgi:hypothetical protein
MYAKGQHNEPSRGAASSTHRSPALTPQLSHCPSMQTVSLSKKLQIRSGLASSHGGRFKIAPSAPIASASGQAAFASSPASSACSSSARTSLTTVASALGGDGEASGPMSEFGVGLQATAPTSVKDIAKLRATLVFGIIRRTQHVACLGSPAILLQNDGPERCHRVPGRAAVPGLGAATFQGLL